MSSDMRRPPMQDKHLEESIAAVEKLQHLVKQEKYAELRNEREKATFSMMMKMNPEALTNIRKEFFAREDSITLDEFIYIIQKHLVNLHEDDEFSMETPEQREFGINMFELFKDIDVNGDGQLEWQEFTSFTVEKANLLNKRAKLASIAHYYDSSDVLDASAQYRHRHDISRFVNLPSLGQFAMVEDHKNAVYLFNARKGALRHTIVTDTAPIAIESILLDRDKETIVTSGADMTLSTYVLDDPNPKRKYSTLSTWATPAVQMALAYARETRVLYSGATNGSIYSWDIAQRSLLNTLTGHSDIVMNLIVLQKLDNIASASLDKTLGVWDSHTNQEILRLYGHRKGVFDLAYNPSYRLMFSCGFEHDACVWSPFVKSLVFRLKGHHASLVGVQTVPNTPEVITADTSGVFKLWDIRNFQCVQTFAANLDGNSDNHSKGGAKLNCFLHTRLPSANHLQKEDDSRIYAASKLLFSFDQARVVHEATSDYTNVFWVAWISASSLIITASERNVIVWDALIGSKMFTHTDISTDEISACCLDDRRRKILLGEVTGYIGVYNASNGQLMKSVHKYEEAIVVSLAYHDEGKRFLAGYANGLIVVYDENVLEECNRIRCFEEFNRHEEMLALAFCAAQRLVVSAEGSSNVVRLWNYDSGKCDVELHVGYGSSCLVVCVALLLPYPIVATSDSTGNLLLWGARGIRWQGLRLAGCLNQTPPECEQEVRDVNRHFDADGSVSATSNNPNASSKDNNGPLYLRSLPPNVDEEEVDKAVHKQVQRQLSQLEKAPTAKIRGLRSSFNPLAEAFQVDPIVQATSRMSAKDLHERAAEKWGKVSAAQCLTWDADSKQLFSGDDLGTLRCFDLQDMLEDLRAEQLVSEPETVVRVQGLCRAKKRGVHAALPPTFEDEEELQAHYEHKHKQQQLLQQQQLQQQSALKATTTGSVSGSQRRASTLDPVATNASTRKLSMSSHLNHAQPSSRQLLQPAASSSSLLSSHNNPINTHNPKAASPQAAQSPNSHSPHAHHDNKTHNLQDDFDAQASLFLLGRAGDAMSYLGIRFRWALPLAHVDRVISATIMPAHGLLTTGADRLVKLWNMRGESLGTLLQSVPIGMRSQHWDLLLDIDGIVRRENEELDEVVLQAKQVAQNPDKPDIRRMDFKGMELGEESASFSRSVLRQRIEKSAQLLGLDFPSHDSNKANAAHAQTPHNNGSSNNNNNGKQLRGDDSMDGMSSIVSAAALSTASNTYLNTNTNTNNASGAKDKAAHGSSNTAAEEGLVGSVVSFASQATSKSHLDAVVELKSTESAVDYVLKTKKMSALQQRRKQTKLTAVAASLEAKTEAKNGIRLRAAAILSLQHEGGGAGGAGGGVHSAGGSVDGRVEAEEALRQAAAEDRKLDDWLAQSAQTDFDAQNKRDDASANADLYSVDLTMTDKTRKKKKEEMEDSFVRRDSVLTMDSLSAPPPVLSQAGHSHHPPGHPHSPHLHAVKSKVKESVQLAHERGARTISMRSSCRKYDAFAALENAMQPPHHLPPQEHLPEEISALRQQRLRKQSELLNDVLPQVVATNELNASTRQRLRSLFQPEKVLEFAPQRQQQQQQQQQQLLAQQQQQQQQQQQIIERQRSLSMDELTSVTSATSSHLFDQFHSNYNKNNNNNNNNEDAGANAAMEQRHRDLTQLPIEEHGHSASKLNSHRSHQNGSSNDVMQRASSYVSLAETEAGSEA